MFLKIVLSLSLFIMYSCSDIESEKHGRFAASSPEDQSEDIFINTVFKIIFTEKVAFDSLTAQKEDGPCHNKHTIHLSSGDFTDCLGMTIILADDGSGRRILLAPTKELPSNTEIALRLTTDIRFEKHDSLPTVTLLRFQTGSMREEITETEE